MTVKKSKTKIAKRTQFDLNEELFLKLLLFLSKFVASLPRFHIIFPRVKKNRLREIDMIDSGLKKKMTYFVKLESWYIYFGLESCS